MLFSVFIIFWCESQPFPSGRYFSGLQAAADLNFDLGGGGGGGNSTYYVTGTRHFAQKIGVHNSVNSGGF